MSSSAIQPFTGNNSSAGKIMLRAGGNLALTVNKLKHPIELIMDHDIEDLKTDNPYVLAASLWPYIDAARFILVMVGYFVTEKKVMSAKKFRQQIRSTPGLPELISAGGLNIDTLDKRMAQEFLKRNVQTINDVKRIQKGTLSRQIKNALLLNAVIKFVIYIVIGMNMWNILHETSAQTVSQMVSYNTNDTEQYVETILLNAYLQLKVLPLIFNSLTKIAVSMGVYTVKRKLQLNLNKNAIEMATPVIAGVGGLCASRLLTTFVTPEILSTLRFNLVNIIGNIKPYERFTPEQLLKMESASTGISFILKSFIGINANMSRTATPINKIIDYQRSLSEFIKTTQKGLLSSLSVEEFAGILALGVAVTEVLVQLGKYCTKNNMPPLRQTPLALRNRPENN